MTGTRIPRKRTDPGIATTLTGRYLVTCPEHDWYCDFQLLANAKSAYRGHLIISHGKRREVKK